MGKIGGIVRLEDLNLKEIFVQLESEFYNRLNQKIKTIGITKLAESLKISNRILLHWLNEKEKCLIRLDVLTKVCTYFNLNFADKIIYLRGKDGRGIKNPKLPFDFNNIEGVRIVAGIMGDGGISFTRKSPYYTNSNSSLIEGYIADVISVFGDVEYTLERKPRKNCVVIVLSFSHLISSVLIELGIQRGKKVENNSNIPTFIFNLEDKCKFTFISQFFDDEGTVNLKARHLSLTSGCLSRYSTSNVLSDVKLLLGSLGIFSSDIYSFSTYDSCRGLPRTMWRLQINGQIQLKKLGYNLILRHELKRDKLQQLINSYKRRVFRRKEFLSTYLGFMDDVGLSKGYFTSLDISKKSGMAIGSCRNLFIQFNKRNLIQCIKPYSRYPYSDYGRYVLK